jgi:hypothetical protein
MPTQDNTTTTQEQQTQTHMTIDTSEIEETSQTQTGQQANPQARHFIQQTLQQYDTTPHKKTNLGGKASTYLRRSFGYIIRTSMVYIAPPT